MLVIAILVILVILLAGTAEAACTGSSPSWASTADESSFQSCVTNAQAAGGTQTITIASGSFTVSTGVLSTLSGSTSLTIVGAGIGNTVITDAGSAGYALKITGASDTQFLDISGITFQDNGTIGHADGMVQIVGTQFSQAFRFHSNAISQTAPAATSGRGIYIYYAYGLIDNNTFSLPGSDAHQQISIDGGSITGADGGFVPWQQPLTLGSNNAVYVEENTFTVTPAASAGEDQIDIYAGARIVIRYNTFVNAHHGFHGLDSGAQRSPVSFEIYGNSYTNNSGSNLSGMQIRGGTGVVFNNTYAGANTYGAYNLVYHRETPGYGSSFGECDGRQNVMGDFYTTASTASRYACDASTSPTPGLGGCAAWSGVTWVESVKFCSGNPELQCTADATCSAAGAGTCSRYLDGDGTGGYPGRDQPGVGPGQVSRPLYEWNNTGAAYGGGFSTTFSLIVANRDFFNATTHPTYTPYTCPHPLNTTTVTCGGRKRFSPTLNLRRVAWPIPYVDLAQEVRYQ